MMLAVLSSLLLPLLTQACLCPSCGCGGGGYGGGYGYSGGYQSQGYPIQRGYSQPYNVFYSQPIPAGRGVEVRASYPYQQQNFQPQYLPPIQPLPQYAQQPQYTPQAPTQYIQPQRPAYVQAPQIPVAPVIRPAAVPHPLNTYELPIIPKTNIGYQPARQVETLTKLNRPVIADSEVEQTTLSYTGTTRKVPAKQGKNKDYEYYYVYYDESGKKVPGTKKPLHDGSIQQRATTLSPENNIDEYDFDDTKTDSPTTIEPVTQPPTIVARTEATTTEAEFIEPQGEVHAVQEITTVAPTQQSVQTKVAEPVSQEDSNGDAIYEDIEEAKTTKTTTAAHVTSAKVEVITFEAPITVKTIETTTTRATTTHAPVTTTAKEGGKDEKNYEYEEYEVEEIQLVNENGVTETVTRIITTTKAPPKLQ